MVSNGISDGLRLLGCVRAIANYIGCISDRAKIEGFSDRSSKIIILVWLS